MRLFRVRGRFLQVVVPLVIGCAIAPQAQGDTAPPSVTVDSDPLLPASTPVPTRSVEGSPGMGSGSFLSRILGSGSATLSAMGTTAILPVAESVVGLDPVFDAGATHSGGIEQYVGADPVIDRVPVSPIDTLSFGIDAATEFDRLPIVAPTSMPVDTIAEASFAPALSAAPGAFAPASVAPDAVILAVPEPLTVALIGMGLGIGVASRARRTSAPRR